MERPRQLLDNLFSMKILSRREIFKQEKVQRKKCKVNEDGFPIYSSRIRIMIVYTQNNERFTLKFGVRTIPLATLANGDWLYTRPLLDTCEDRDRRVELIHVFK